MDWLIGLLFNCSPGRDVSFASEWIQDFDLFVPSIASGYP